MAASTQTLVFCLALAFSGCLNWGVEYPSRDSDTDADVDADADADTESEADGDGDADADNDFDVDIDIDGDSGADGDADADGDSDVDVDADKEGDADPDEDADDDALGDADVDADSASACEFEVFEVVMQPVRVMFLLDQSSSMREAIPWLPGRSRWEEATDGLTHLVEDTRIRDSFLGLDAFPDGTIEYFEGCWDECCSDPVCFATQLMRCMNLSARCDRGCDVDLPPIVPLDRAFVSGTAIIEYMSHDFLPGAFASTPLVEQMHYYLEDHRTTMVDFYSGDDLSYLVTISDGDDTCYGDPEDPEMVDAIVAELGRVADELVDTWHIRSFAIGFGDTSGDMARELNAIASNGGTEFTEFFSVDEAGELRGALDSISASIMSCVYDVSDHDAVADPDEVNFYFDSELVGYDATCSNGWRWTDASHLQVEFCGASCARLREGEVADVEGRFGCPTIYW